MVFSLLFVMFAAWWMVSTQMATPLSPIAKLRIGPALGWGFLLLALWLVRFAWGTQTGIPLGILVFALTVLALIYFEPRGLTYSRATKSNADHGLRRACGQTREQAR